MTIAQTHYRNGDLAAATAAMAEELRQQPGHAGKRAFYVELLCLQGAFKQADRQLDTLLRLDPQAMLGVGAWRQLVHAAQARLDCFGQGRTPALVGPPTPRIEAQLEILLALREGDSARAGELARAQEAARPACAASVNGRPVADVRDLDDLCAGILEVLASNGKYFWIDFEQIVSLELSAPQRPLDLLWRKARLLLTSGSEGEVFIPSIYATPTDDEAALLGRKTEWLQAAGLVRGIGQRSWLVGEEALPLAELTTLERAEAAALAEG